MIYITHGKMSKEGLNGLTAKPENRAEALEKMVDALGGKLVDYYFLLNGEIDFIIVSEFPDDQNVNELSLIDALLVRGSGAIESITTLPALRAADAVPLFERAKALQEASTYSKPGEWVSETQIPGGVCLRLFVVAGTPPLA